MDERGSRPVRVGLTFGEFDLLKRVAELVDEAVLVRPIRGRSAENDDELVAILGDFDVREEFALRRALVAPIRKARIRRRLARVHIRAIALFVRRAIAVVVFAVAADFRLWRSGRFRANRTRAVRCADVDRVRNSTLANAHLAVGTDHAEAFISVAVAVVVLAVAQIRRCRRDAGVRVVAVLVVQHQPGTDGWRNTTGYYRLANISKPIVVEIDVPEPLVLIDLSVAVIVDVVADLDAWRAHRFRRRLRRHTRVAVAILIGVQALAAALDACNADRHTRVADLFEGVIDRLAVDLGHLDRLHLDHLGRVDIGGLACRECQKRQEQNFDLHQNLQSASADLFL